MAIYVIDEIMGRGKTSAMINFINQSDQKQRFLYVTPYLTEVDRICKACASRDFFDPGEHGGKLRNLKRMLQTDTNIVTTHALFNMFDSECIDLIQEKNYVLVMDEVATVFEPMPIEDSDAHYLLTTLVDMEHSGRLHWKDPEYKGVFLPLKQMVMTGCAYAYTDTMWVRMMPTKMFSAFKDVYLMTYMFDCQIQRYYFDFASIPYERKYVHGHTRDEYTIGDDPDPMEPVDYRDLINVFDDDNLNKVGKNKTALSKGWYMKHTTEESLKELKNATYNFFQNKSHAKSSELIWTTFLGDDDKNLKWKRLLSGNGYTKGFLACNARGTNKFKDRTAVAYLVNRYPNPMQVVFFKRNGIEFDQDRFALSEMLQWLWRAAIRDGQKIDVFVPSARMRNLLNQWIEENSPA